MVHVGILRRVEIWAATPAGSLTFHLTIEPSRSQAEKFPSTNSEETFLFIFMSRENCKICWAVLDDKLYSTFILLSSRVNSILELRPTATIYWP